MTIHVKLAVYDGPLDILLELIRKNEMDIYDIPIAEITRQYLEALAEMKQLDLEIAGEFLVMAATLIYIKSRMLLPQEAGDGEDDLEEDPRAELVRKLLEYQAFKEAARELGLLADERSKVFTRQITEYYLEDVRPEDLPAETFTANLYDLVSAFQKVITQFGREALHEVYEEIISIEEKMAEIRRLLGAQERILFSELFHSSRTRNELIATFLALLELVRSGVVSAAQPERFGEIMIQRKIQRESVPREDQGRDHTREGPGREA